MKKGFQHLLCVKDVFTKYAWVKKGKWGKKSEKGKSA